jgi:hypothetical protein
MGLQTETTNHFLLYLILNVISEITTDNIACGCRRNMIKSPKKIGKKMFLPIIEKNTPECRKGSKKNRRRKNVDFHFMLKINGTNGTLTVDFQNT